jgi:hypothetical protein
MMVFGGARYYSINENTEDIKGFRRFLTVLIIPQKREIIVYSKSFQKILMVFEGATCSPLKEKNCRL